MDLEEYNPKIYLQITPEKQNDDQFWTDLKALLQSKPGNIPVYLYHLANRQTIKTTEEFWLGQDEEVLKRLKDLLGEENFKQI